MQDAELGNFKATDLLTPDERTRYLRIVCGDCTAVFKRTCDARPADKIAAASGAW
jgi:hypothetical protein